MAKKKMGTPTKLNERTLKAFTGALLKGNHYSTACAYAGINYHTFRNWMHRGEAAQSGIYFNFFTSVKKALAQAEINSVSKIKQAEDDDWKAAAWMLERRHPERWANTRRIKVEVEKELDKALEFLEAKMSPDAYTELLAGLASQGEGEEEDS